MDTRRMILWFVVSMALVFGWFAVQNWLFTRYNWRMPGQSAPNTASTQPAAQPAATQQAVAATQPGATQPGALQTTAPSLSAPALAAAPAEQAQSVTIGSPRKDSAYHLALTTRAEGASIAAVTLNQFTAQVGSDAPYVFQQPYNPADPATYSMATRSLSVNGTTVDLAHVAWRLVRSTEDSAVYAIDLRGPSREPLLTVEKTYAVRPKADASQGYEVTVQYAIHSPGGQPFKDVKLAFNGPNSPPAENRNDLPSIVSGYDERGFVTIQHYAIGSLKEQESFAVKSDNNLPMLWAGVSSAYFNAIVLDRYTPSPATAAQTQPATAAAQTQPTVAPLGIASVQAWVAPSPAEHPHTAASLAFETAPVEVKAGATASLPMQVFFGPKQRSLLNSSYYSSYSRSYDKTLVLTSGVCGYCTFGWLVDGLVSMLKAFHDYVFHDWGLAIIALVLVVRLLLHPITKRSQISMSKMGKMGPEMERLKKKYGDNKEELNRAMVAMYKEQGFTPVLGCLPMFLQMPIWIALWQALQSTFELRQASFLWGWTWIKDLSQPDRFYAFSHPIPLLFGWSIDAVNLLPLLMGVVFWLQQKYMPKAAAATKEQEQQQKMMQWMTLLFPLMLYSGPAGLNLYILTSTAIGIVESKRIRDHIKAQEEAEKAGRVIVDAKPTRVSRRLADDKRGGDTRKRGIMSWLADLQAKADEMRREGKK